MARYQVEAEGQIKSSASPTDPMFVLVRVTNEDGTPVTGLTRSSFTVWSTASLFGEQEVKALESFESVAGIPAGTYQLKTGFSIQTPGQYAFILKVTSQPQLGRASTGATLFSVVKL